MVSRPSRAPGFRIYPKQSPTNCNSPGRAASRAVNPARLICSAGIAAAHRAVTQARRHYRLSGTPASKRPPGRSLGAGRLLRRFFEPNEELADLFDRYRLYEVGIEAGVAGVLAV